MPNFTYIGQRMDGTEERGIMEGSSAEDVRERLRKRGVIVDQVTPAPLFTPAEPLAVPKATPVQTVMPPKPAKASAPEANLIEEDPHYIPLVDTFRLYAGWLLAWYSLVYLLGSYQYLKGLPFEIPFLEGLFLSPLVLKFAFGTFLFLLVSSVHRAMGRGIWKGVFLTIVWLVLVTLFSLNA
jgi:hypothetical protein